MQRRGRELVQPCDDEAASSCSHATTASIASLEPTSTALLLVDFKEELFRGKLVLPEGSRARPSRRSPTASAT